MRRREFIEGLASAAALPSTAGAQQHTVPVVGFLHQQTAESAADLVTAFRAGLEATGFVEGRNVVIELGPATVALFEAIMKAKPHPEQGFRSCLGIISLLKSYGPGRVEAACRRGNNIGATTYGSIASILKTGLDRAYAEQNDFTRKETDEAPFHHENIRGRDYYH